jgi:type III restriction enzyme
MKYSFKEHEQNFAQWCRDDYPLMLENGKAQRAREFLKHISAPNFSLPLFKHSLEALKRSVYSYEVLGKKDLLLEIVTGGGKTTIIGGMIAYMRIVHDINRFLILVPNTIVRSRLVDAFDPASRLFIYSEFKFLENYEHLKNRISLHIMEQGRDPVGIRTANIVLGNIHQIYEGKISLDIIQKNLGNIVIFNDEAHNSKAENYNEVLNRLKPQRILRIDTTATPDRLDGLHPDSEKIIEYGIRQAMHDRIIKRIIVCKPEIEKVKLTYQDVETGQEIKAEEIPWDEIDRKRIVASKYVVSDKPMRQQIAIAKQCLDYQKKCIPNDIDGKPKWKPLLFIVAISIKDAMNIARVLRDEFHLETLLVTNESEESEKEEAMEINKHLRDCKYDAIVSVLMLREGWDVKNISVILLFRKFSFKLNPYTEEKYSVYGQQVIGRGLRRINPFNKESWEECFVVDHPILKHDWLWEMLDADQYQGTLNPDELLDIAKIPQPKPIDGNEVEEEGTTDAGTLHNPIEDIIAGIPDPPKKDEEPGYRIIYEWQDFLDNYKYQMEKIDIEQTITEVKKRKLASGFNEQESYDDLKINVQAINELAEMSIDDLKKAVVRETLRICYDALREYDQNPDKRQEIIYSVITDHIKKRFLLGSGVVESTDHLALKKLYFALSEMREVFLDPGLVEGILTKPPQVVSL